jgi:hypothetical protein
MQTYNILTRDLDLPKQLYGTHVEQDMVLDYLESQDFMSGVKVI